MHFYEIWNKTDVNTKTIPGKYTKPNSNMYNRPKMGRTLLYRP